MVKAPDAVRSHTRRGPQNQERMIALRELWTIFASYFRVGLLTFGGGYSIIPMLEKEAINKYNWLTKEELLDFFAVSQCIPGVIATNMAVMVGNKVKKLSGAVAASVGVVMPSLLIIMIIAAFLQNFADLEIVQNAFWGIRVVVAALIFGVVLSMFKTGIVDKLTFVIFVVVFLCSVFLSLSPIWYVVGAALCGLAATRLRKAREGGAG